MNRYRRGYRIELRVRDLLRKEGYLVLRSAGSKGPADLVAIGKNGEVRLIQVKRIKEAKLIPQVLSKITVDLPLPLEIWFWIDSEGRWEICLKERTVLP